MADIIVGSVGVQLLPSAERFVARTRALLRGLSVPVRLDPTGFDEQIDRERKKQEKNPVDVLVRPKALDAFAASIKKQAEAIQKSVSVDLPLTAAGERLRQDIAAQVETISKLVKVEVPVDLEDAAALRNKMAVELDLLEVMAKSAHPTVDVDADTGKAQAKIGALDSSARGAGVGMGLLTAAAIGLAPALVPATAAVGGLVAALTAPALAAGGGLVGFIGVAGVAISKTEAVNKQIKELSKQAENATNMATAKRYQAQAQALIDSLTGPQKALLTAQHAVSTAFGSLMKSAGPAIFAPFVTGLNLLAAILPRLTPLLNAVSGAFDQILTSVNASVQSGGFDKAISFFSRMAGPSITGLATILGNIGKGFLSIAQASSGLGGSLLNSLERMTASFAHIGQTKGFQSFLAYVAQVGPQVAHTLGSIVAAVANIGRALAPLGGPALAAIKGIADVIARMNPTLLGLIASSIGGMVIGLKGLSIVTALTAATRKFAEALVAMDVAMDANIVGAIVIGITALGAALVYAWTKSETFRKIVVTGIKAVADAFLTVASVILRGADKAFGWIKPLHSKLGGAIQALDSFKKQTNAILDSITKTVTITLNIQRIDTSGPGNAALNAEHSGGYKIPAAKSTTSTPDLSYDPSLFSTPSTTAATNAANAKANAKAAAKAAKLRDNDSLLKSVKALRSAGRQLTAALTQGLKDGNGGLQKYLDKIKSDIGAKLASGDISKAAAKSMRKTVNAISKGLKSIEAQYDAAVTKIKSLQDARAQVVSSVSSGLTGELDLSQGVSQANQFGYGGGQATFASVSSVITGLASRLKTFLGLITQLKGRGVPGVLLQEIASLGSTQGAAVARALLSGTQAQIGSLSSVFNSIFATNDKEPSKGGYAQQIGDLIGGQLYDAGIAAQQGLLKGLLDDKGITAAGGKLAKKLTKAIRKALHIHSPSKLMAAQVGIPTGQGIGDGTLAAIDDWTPQVAKRLGNITPATFGAGAFGNGGGMAQSDIERLADAIAGRPSYLTMDDRTATKVVLRGSNSRLATSLRPA